MRFFLFSLFILNSFTSSAQFKVTTNENYEPFAFAKNIQFQSYSDGQTHYMLVKRVENFENIHSLIVTDASGTLVTVKDIRIPTGVLNNDFSVKNIVMAGSRLVAFIENRDKSKGKNTLTMRTVDENGSLGASQPVAEFDFLKMSNSGDWYISPTPDKKHIAVLAKLPYEKDKPNQFKYYFLDEGLKLDNSGQFTANGFIKDINLTNFLASDKGDLYIISEEMDKTYTYPVVYKSVVGSDQNIRISAAIPDPSLKNLNYSATISPAGDLILSGYLQQKRAFVAGDVQAVGGWIFNSSRPEDIKLYKFDKPIPNLNILNILFNGDTFFVVGEEYKAERRQASTPSAVLQGENISYSHGNIHVAAFSADGGKKFEIPISRDRRYGENNRTHLPASGIFKDKLFLIFNDNAEKYAGHGEYSLTITVTISNDGLMDPPATYKTAGGSLIDNISTQLYSVGPDRIVTLREVMEKIAAVTFAY